MGRRTTTTDGTATAMEQGEADIVGFGQTHQGFLAAYWAQPAAIMPASLAGVGVTDHHILTALNVAAIPVHREQALHHGGACHQVILSFKQRGNRHAERAARLFEQQLHRPAHRKAHRPWR